MRNIKIEILSSPDFKHQKKKMPYSNNYFNKTPHERALISIAKLNILQTTKLEDLVKNYQKRKTKKTKLKN